MKKNGLYAFLCIITCAFAHIKHQEGKVNIQETKEFLRDDFSWERIFVEMESILNQPLLSLKKADESSVILSISATLRLLRRNLAVYYTIIYAEHHSPADLQCLYDPMHGLARLCSALLQ